MLPQETQELLKIPQKLLEQLFPSSTASIQDLLAHKIPYQRPSAHQTQSSAYLHKRAPTRPEVDPTGLATPPPSVILEIIEALQLSPEEKYTSIACAHIPGNHETYPLWILSYWAELGVLRNARKSWDLAIKSLETRINRKSSDVLAGEILDRVLVLPWASGLRGFDECGVEGLVNFCTPKAWFRTAEVNQMLELVDNANLSSRGIKVLPSDFPRNLVQLHRDEGLEYITASRHRHLRQLGEDSVNGVVNQFATVANVDDDHWVALVIDFGSKTVRYFDSLNNPINAELREAFDWWIDQHHAAQFDWVCVPCTQQGDSYVQLRAFCG
ncbi:hypothetical protein R3P38DRAFT_2519179 [Favolaschia claudopus]|uniref:Ubiquitin-like protease family profile domain-containing protein n=1 Tax=Favolaschia claudopus TaxID=2862362 RepID=A0AAW0C6S9_9AGAR